MKYKLSAQQISTTIADETVILDHAKGIYYGLDEVGTLIWDYLGKTAASVDELVAQVKENYEVETKTCQTDVEELLNELMKEKLVEIVP